MNSPYPTEPRLLRRYVSAVVSAAPLSSFPFQAEPRSEPANVLGLVSSALSSSVPIPDMRSPDNGRRTTDNG